MIQKMPISEFTWLKERLTKADIEAWDVDGDYGCFVEVDMSIPDKWHDKFNCYPILPEPLEINEQLISPASMEIRQKRMGERGSGEVKFSSTKLAPNLLPKKKYICHIRNLQFYLRHGAVLDSVHRVLKFKQVGVNYSIIIVV
jgi:hypothetical protein